MAAPVSFSRWLAPRGCAVLPTVKTIDEARSWVSRQRQLRARFNELLPTIQNADCLVPTSELVIAPNGGLCLRRETEIPIAPHWRVREVAAFLRARADLWRLAS